MPDERAPVFLDTACVYASLNSRDEWHDRAQLWETRLALERRQLITTQLILVEIADGLASMRFRAKAVEVLTALQSNSFIEVVAMTTEILDDAFDLYSRRSDKEWGMTDCVSFVVMRERGLLEALTMDQHFQQAGFRALLREP